MTTTPSTASQAPAVSISEDKRFTALTDAIYHTGFHQAGSGDREVKALADFFDAKLAQAREREWKDIWAIADAELEEMQDKINHYADRATAAEAKLEAIRQGVEDLPVGLATDYAMACYFDGYSQCRRAVLNLLHPQPQADESGLPG